MMNELINKTIDDVREELLIKTDIAEEKQWENDCDSLVRQLQDADHRARLSRLNDDAISVRRAYFDAGFYAGIEFCKAMRARFK